AMRAAAGGSRRTLASSCRPMTATSKINVNSNAATDDIGEQTSEHENQNIREPHRTGIPRRVRTIRTLGEKPDAQSALIHRTDKQIAIGPAGQGRALGLVPAGFGLFPPTAPWWRCGSPIVAGTPLRLAPDIMVDHGSCIAGPSATIWARKPGLVQGHRADAI